MRIRVNPIIEKELTLSSGEAIRIEWLSYYHDIERKLFKLKREWNAFEKEAHDTFRTWYHSTFSQYLSDVRNLEEQAREIQTILSAIESQIVINGLSKRAAYEQVMAAVKAKVDPFPTRDEEFFYREQQRSQFREQFVRELEPEAELEIDEELLERAREMVARQAKGKFNQPRSQFEADWLEGKLKDMIRATYERLLDQRDEDLQDEFRRLSEEEAPPSSEEMDEELAEEERQIPDDLKTLYRKIVKVLHPDRGSEMNEEEKELWTQAQRAYRSHDTGTLRVILLRLEGGGLIDIHQVESVGEIMKLTQALHFEFQEINDYKNRVKKDPVYRFWASRSKPKNREILKLEIERGLKHQRYSLGMTLREFQDDLDYLQQSLSRKARGRRR